MGYAPTPSIGGGGNVADNYDLPEYPPQNQVDNDIPPAPLAQMPPAGGTVEIHDAAEENAVEQ